MRRLAGLLAVLALAAPAHALPGGPLHADGRFFRDAQGRVVVLHGFFATWKIAGKFAPDDSATDPAGFTAADADAVAGLGLNSTRLGWFWRGLEPVQGTYDEVYLEKIARVARLLTERGVFVTLDSHQDMYNERFKGLGFPDWATFDDGIPLGADRGFPANYFGPAVSHTFDNFWLGHAGVLDAYGRQLAHVAQRFKADPMIVGYDMMNEPWPGSQYPTCAQPEGCPAFDRTLLQSAQDGWAAAIRAVDRTHFVFYEPTLFFNVGVRSWLTTPPAGTAPVGLSFHDQCLTRGVYQASGGQGAQANGFCPTSDDQNGANALATAAALGGPALQTEVAAAADSDYAGLECLLERNDRNMVGWNYGLSWRSGELRHLDATKAAVLRRAYPRAIAGTPTSYGFDPRTGSFTLRYARDPQASAATVIELPLAVYPGGYRVTAGGARVVSEPGAEQLELRNDPGPGTVAVDVAPALGGPAANRPQLPACAAGVATAPVARRAHAAL
jgi:endoglycosylceramidase